MPSTFKPVFFLLSALAFAAVLYVSCNKDNKTTVTVTSNKCSVTVCANGGICDSATGSCTCPSGYEGTNCETIARNKFIGNWSVLEKGTITTAAQYNTSIQGGTHVGDIIIINFNNFFSTPVSATVSGDTIIIPNQQLQGKVIFGIGSFNRTSGQLGGITMRYEVIDTATNIVNDFGYYPADLSDPSTWNK